MSKYRKKPVVIEAFQVRAVVPLGQTLAGDVPQWFWDAVTERRVDVQCGVDHGYVDIHTLEGKMRADEGDFIIRGVKGELYPCKPDIFEVTYEAAE